MRKFTYFFLILILVVSFSFFSYKKSSAFIPFGGITVTNTPPVCTNGLYLLVNGQPFLLPPGARIYAYGSFIPFVKIWSLGMYTPLGVCIQPFPLPPIPVTGIINMIGTSLPSF